MRGQPAVMVFQDSKRIFEFLLNLMAQSWVTFPQAHKNKLVKSVMETRLRERGVTEIAMLNACL